MSAIDVTEVTRRFGDLTVLDSLSFSVEDGEVFGLVGPNGAGKTTTVNVLTGVVAPDSGTVRVLGLDPTADSTGVRAAVGILPEKESPPAFLTPREYFSFVADVREIPADVARDRMDEWVDHLAFSEKLDVLCKDLSRGQQQKVMFAQAFLHEPELVFIDEPLANLDPLMQEVITEFITSYHAAGNTIVLSTHQLDIAEEICTRIGVLHDGSIATEHVPGGDESVRDVFKRTVTASVARAPVR